MEFTTEYFGSLVEQALENIDYPTTAPKLFDPIKYTLSGGGKRLRPSLLLAAFSALSHKNPQEAMNQALGIEMFHNFTLLHDDVMDKADIRRGRPTVHRRWNENAAILSGDAMLTMSCQLIACCAGDKLQDLLSIFNTTAMEVYEGQQLDMEFERRNDVAVSEYLEMIRLKTSVLLACSCAIGALMAGAGRDVVKAFYDYGINLGLAFQLRDDWLDTYGDPAIFGKEIGGDIVNRKKTWLLINGLSEAGEELGGIISENLDDRELIAQVVRVYDRLNLGERCCLLAERFSKTAIDALENVELNHNAREFFIQLALKAANRSH